MFSLRRFGPTAGRAAAVCLVLLAGLHFTAHPLAAQTNGVWNSTAPSAVWSAGLNWQGLHVARGAGAIADFSQQTLPNNVTVHLDTARVVGSLVFGDVGDAFNWTLDNNASVGNLLTLSTPLATPVVLSAQPTIAVKNGTVTIADSSGVAGAGVLSGSQGLIVNPNGETGTLVLSGGNTFYDMPTFNNAPNGGAGAITIDGGTLSINADVAPGTTHSETPSPLGYLPPGSFGSGMVSGATYNPADILINGGTLQATATFQISSFRGIALGSLTGGGGGTISVTGGNVLTYGYDPGGYTENGGGGGGLYAAISDYNTGTGSSLTLIGGGTLLLTSPNTYTGATNINGAGFTLQAGIANTISRFSGVSVATTATFLLNGFSQSIGSLAGAGSVTNNSSTNVSLTLGTDNSGQTFSGVISNTTGGNTGIISALIKCGTGTETLSTPNGASWINTGAGGGYDLAGPNSGTAPVIAVNGGTLTLDLSHASTQSNLINPYYALQLGGGTLSLNEPTGSLGTSQTFNGTTVSSGGSAIVVATNGSTNAGGFVLGAIVRNSGATVDFAPGATAAGRITTTTPNGSGTILGGWATFGGGTTWAVTGSSGTNPVTGLSSFVADTWASANDTTVTTNDTPPSGSTTNSLRFNAAGPATGGLSVTLTGASTISSGGILVTPNAGVNGATIAGSGSLTSGNGADLIVNQFDTAGPLTISVPIAGSIGLTKSGPGTLILSDASTYSGSTTINGGVLRIASDASGDLAGLSAPLGQSASLVLNGATLQPAGSPGNSLTLNANRGVALGPASGTGGGTFNVPATMTLTVPGIIANNGTSVSSLTKTGAGTLILGNTGNTFSGGLYINQGTVIATTFTDNVGPNNTITFTGNSTLQFTTINGFNSVPVVINSGVTATFDMNIGPGGGPYAGLYLNRPISGGGGFNYISSAGNTDGANISSIIDILYATPVTATNWSYTGPTTIYSTTLVATWDTINGAPFINLLNPKNVLNLGGTLAIAYEGDGPIGDSAPTTVLATSVNLIADTSSYLHNGGVVSTSRFYLSASANGIVRNSGSTLNIDTGAQVYVNSGAVTNTNGIIGGWATTGSTSNSTYSSVSIPGTDWASVNTTTGAIVALGTAGSGGSYTNDAWASGNNTTVTMSSAPASASTTNSLRFVSLTSTSGASLNQALTLSGVNVIQSGGILVTTNYSIVNTFTITPGTDNSTFTIAGGSLTSGNGTDLIVNQCNALSGSSLTISSAIVNDGATPIGLTLGGIPEVDGNPSATGGTLILTNPGNSYTGPTVISAISTLETAAPNVIPSTSAVIISLLGTLNLEGNNQSIGSLANFDGSLAALSGVNFGYATTVTTTTAATLTVGGDNTSTTFNGALKDGSGPLSLVKVGSGTLTLGNFNDNITFGSVNLTNYSGGTTITGGTLDILYDADLGAVPNVPTTNITFNGTGTLRFDTTYFGTSLSTNRSIVVTSGQSGTLDTNGNNITYAGLLTSSGTFGKAGAGILEMDGAPTLNANSGLSVTGGTLRMKYGTAPTVGGMVSGAVSNGATLELAGSVSQLSQSVNIANAGTLLDSSSVNQNVGVVTSTGATIVNAGGSLTDYEIRQNSLTIADNAKVTLLPSGSGSATTPAAPNNVNFGSNVASLSLGGTLNAWTGTLDIGNNGLVIQYGAGSDPFTTITNMVKSGYANGNWTGTGITSSMARAAVLLGSPTPALNIGLIDFIPNTGTFGSSIVFAGQTIATSAVLVRLTYMDDLVLSGDMAQANATSDALFFAANYGSGTVWHVGDITHDGVIDTNDALLFAANYVVGLPSLDGTTGNAGALGGNAAAVPEPASILTAGIGTLVLIRLTRRGRKPVVRLSQIPASRFIHGSHTTRNP